MDIQLSISQLASDRPSALERCLHSLTPLLMQVPSELIIVHTGTDPDIRKLACRYTDLIIPFTWCNDFSAARNAGINAAKGEWFLYIDDDEWFEDTSEICAFFQSGEYRRYGMACYRQRNYSDWSGTCYTDFQAMRMMRMVPGIHFQNPIHEEPTPLSQPCKYFDTFVHHYGYVRTSGYSKSSRNLALLKKDVERRPDYIKNYIQLVLEYAVEEKWAEAEKYCRKGLDICKRKGSLSDSCFGWLQSELAELLYISRDYRGAEEEALAALEKDSTRELASADLYATLILVADKCKNYEKTLQFGLKFEETLGYIEQNPYIWTEQNYGSLSEDKVKDPKRLCRLRMACLEAALNQGCQKQAAFFFLRLPWDTEEQIERLYPNFDRLDIHFHTTFTALLKMYPSNSLYQLFHDAIYDKDEPEERKRLLIRCMTESESDFLRQRVVKEILSSGTELNDIVCKLDLDSWLRYLDGIVKKLSDSEAKKAWEACSTLSECHLFYKLMLKKELLGRSLVQGYYTGGKFIKTLSEYTDNILLYYKAQYREEMFHQDKFELLPQSCRFALLVSKAVQQLEQKDYTEAARLLCLALPLDTSMTGVVNELRCQIVEEIKNPVQDRGDEFQMLAKQMKAALKTMLKKRQYQEALSVMTQLLSLLPGDLELLKIRQKLLRQNF